MRSQANPDQTPRSVADRLFGADSVGADSVLDQPVVGQPVVGQSVLGQAVIGNESLAGQRFDGRPFPDDRSLVDQRLGEEPLTGRPPVGEPLVGGSAVDGGPPAGQSLVAGSAAVRPAVAEPLIARLDSGDVARDVAGHLDYLTQLTRELGVSDPVEEYFAPVVGSWSDMHDEAERWRRAGQAAEAVTAQLTQPLGGLDAAWQGADADSFLEHMRQVGLAGQDMSDAMTAMADALDQTASGLSQLVRDLAQVLAEAAELLSEAVMLPLLGEERARQYLDEMNRPTKELFEAVRDVLEAFVRLCDGVQGEQLFADTGMEHRFPDQNWTFTDPDATPAEPLKEQEPEKPAATGASGTSSAGTAGIGGAGIGGGSVGTGSLAAPGPQPEQPLQPGSYSATTPQEPRPVEEKAGGRSAAAAAAAAAKPGAGGMMGGGMMPMMGGMAGGQQGEEEHKARQRLTVDPEEIFGEPEATAPPVLGEDED
ncbi:WXG100 family type VII secretion target [Goodfellowiella coeruleoviolacea]|uniref:WXG100 family type VII secretion target n=1 Tax=Goodfellowiella coeruleoviolacea TaxID=334858 RepID=A0AAE3KGV6_9PSEU|nr:WXG100 family type VII secretion target [Goodfellowiella coeruleoviolacea]MCP2165814.1 hypothetical protein [Goodfellowiella coeruleoviolacea]